MNARRYRLLQQIRDAYMELEKSGMTRAAADELLNEMGNDEAQYRHPGTHVRAVTTAGGTFQLVDDAPESPRRDT